MRLMLILIALAATAFAGCTDTDEPGDELEPENEAAEPSTEIEALVQHIDMSTSGVWPVNPGLAPGDFTVARNTTLMVTYTNADSNPMVVHDLYFSGVDEQTPALSSGESAELEFLVDLPPGEYPYWCAIGSHREQGMEGVMIVTA